MYSFGLLPDGEYPYGLLVYMNGQLYGAAVAGGDGGCNCGTVFSVNPKTGTETTVYSFCSQAACGDGAVPLGGLLNVNGTLYGVTEYGGTGTCTTQYGGCGAVFAITP